jgi:hypothetical protein
VRFSCAASTGQSIKLNAFDNFITPDHWGDLIGYNGVCIRLPGTDSFGTYSYDSAQALGFRWGAGLVSSVAGRTTLLF